MPHSFCNYLGSNQVKKKKIRNYHFPAWTLLEFHSIPISGHGFLSEACDFIFPRPGSSKDCSLSLMTSYPCPKVSLSLFLLFACSYLSSVPISLDVIALIIPSLQLKIFSLSLSIAPLQTLQRPLFLVIIIHSVSLNEDQGMAQTIFTRC